MVRHFPCCKAKAIDDLKLDHVMDVFVKTDLTYDLTFSVFEKRKKKKRISNKLLMRKNDGIKKK